MMYGSVPQRFPGLSKFFGTQELESTRSRTVQAVWPKPYIMYVRVSTSLLFSGEEKDKTVHHVRFRPSTISRPLQVFRHTRSLPGEYGWVSFGRRRNRFGARGQIL